ncbi:MAG: DUF3892 domain-containing protein [Clostridiales bacterium]|jgi:hypothetical protein|nr:DUF3892 domain-containing protein [Clostridiales bacterium]
MDTTQKPDLSTLPLMAMSEIPTPQPNARHITGLVKDSGKITGYQLSDGQVISKEQGVELARQGGIAAVGIATNQGTEYLKSLPDQSEGNNLGSLPTVTQE